MSGAQTGEDVTNEATPHDPEWFTAAKGGDENALRDLFESCFPPVFRLFYWMCPDTTWAESEARKVLLEGTRRFGNFSSCKDWDAWVYRDAAQFLLKTTLPVSCGVNVAAGQAATDAVLRDALSAMRPQHRLVFILRELMGKTYPEMSGHLGFKRGEIMAYMHYARQQWLKKRGAA